jgi:hypothetical protein
MGGVTSTTFPLQQLAEEHAAVKLARNIQVKTHRGLISRFGQEFVEKGLVEKHFGRILRIWGAPGGCCVALPRESLAIRRRGVPVGYMRQQFIGE